jgi:hypothetical protein
MSLSRLIDFLETRASPKGVVILVMAILPFNALLFPLVGDKLEEISGYRMLDTLFNYSPADAFTRIAAYGYPGRLLYLLSSWSVDFVYPIIYTFLLAFLLTLFLRRSFSPENPLIRMQLLPFGMLFFDYLENGMIAILLAVYPAQPIALALAASLFTSLKWCFAVISFIALLISIAALLLSFSRGTNSKGNIQ